MENAADVSSSLVNAVGVAGTEEVASATDQRSSGINLSPPVHPLPDNPQGSNEDLLSIGSDPNAQPGGGPIKRQGLISRVTKLLRSVVDVTEVARSLPSKYNRRDPLLHLGTLYGTVVLGSDGLAAVNMKLLLSRYYTVPSWVYF